VLAPHANVNYFPLPQSATTWWQAVPQALDSVPSHPRAHRPFPTQLANEGSITPAPAHRDILCVRAD